jgi:hypothetical protein
LGRAPSGINLRFDPVTCFTLYLDAQTPIGVQTVTIQSARDWLHALDG